MKIICLTKNNSFPAVDFLAQYEHVFKSELKLSDQDLDDTKLLIIDNLDGSYDGVINKLKLLNPVYNVLILANKNDYKILEIKNHNFEYLITPFNEGTFILTITKILYDHLSFDHLSSHKELLKIISVVFNNSKKGFMITKSNRLESYQNSEVIYMNDGLKDILKMNLEKFQKTKLFKLIYEDDLPKLVSLHQQMQERVIDNYQFESRIKDLEGSVKWIQISKHIIEELDEQTYLSLYIIDDVTKNQRVREILFDSNQTLAILSTNFPGIVYRSHNDVHWTFDYLSSGIENLTGYSIADFMEDKTIAFNQIIDPKHQKYVRDVVDEAILNNKSFTLEYQIIRKDGSKVWVLEKGGITYNDQGEVVFLEGVIFNIDTEKQKEAALIYNLNHHYLTNLYNRIFLENFLEKESKTPNFYNSVIVKLKVIYLKDIIKYYGMKYVNKIIITISTLLKELTDDDITLFYSHDNQFVIYFRDGLSHYHIDGIVTKIEQKLARLFNFQQITFVLGVMPLNDYEFKNSDLLLNDLLITADQEIVQKSPMVVHHFNVLKKIENELEKDVINQLEIIVNKENDDSFFIVAQPILDLKTNKITGIEALARLNHPKHGFISPLQFIKLAEQTKIIDELGLLILNKTFNFMRSLKSHNLDDLYVSINISALQINSKDFVENIKYLINKYQINPHKLIFELTESVLVSNVKLANEVFHKIRDLGIKISIDDFGTGFSSLDILSALNVDIIKIDKVFTFQIISENDNKSIIKDIISMSHRMNRTVVAEGVEKQVDIDYLKLNKADHAQGYFISRPLKIQEIIDFVIKYNN